ncbi:sigma factor [Streptomyces sp. Root369]|uniref:sigma factor n=1 Tax=Streptomyces sp. Root369 TaxID=1736523 RepID=UPI001F5C071E|nr:sigma factor [Streptomyces sp. Root369]
METDFDGFVAALSAALFRGALVLTGNRDAAEDLVQEILERACRKWRTISVKDAPEAYARRIMVNLANDRWRRFRRTALFRRTGPTGPPGATSTDRSTAGASWCARCSNCPCGCGRWWYCGTSTTSRTPRSGPTWASR